MPQRTGVSTRGILVASGLVGVPVLLALSGWPPASELPAVKIWQPHDILIALGGLGVTLLLLLVRRVPEMPPRAAMGLAFLLAILPVGLGQALLPAPVSNDEQSYLYQAELFAEGRIAEDLQEPALPLRRRQVHEDPARGLRYSKYPPGTALALAPATLLGLPPVMVALAAFLDLLLARALARRMGLLRPERAVLLLAASPFFLLVHTSFQSEVFTLPAALAGSLALLRFRAAPPACLRWGAAVGACAGWIFLARPLTGMVFAAAVLPGLLAGGGARRALRGVCGAVLGGLPFLAAVLLYQRALTGDALRTPYAAYAGTFSPWDVYPFFRSEFALHPGAAFVRGVARQTARWAPALGGVFGLAGLGFWALARLRRLDGGAGLGFALLLPIAYGLHWYPGHWAYLGPLYSFEALGSLAVATAWLLEKAPAGWGRAVLWAALVSGPALFGYRFPVIRDHALQRAAPQRIAEEQHLPADAVVLLPWYAQPARTENAFKWYTPSRSPFGPGRVFLRQLPERAATFRMLADFGLAGRPVFRFATAPDGSGARLAPFEPPG